jgi:hypothetical protein
VSDETGRDPDARDERVAALLEVPALDDVTRRRLVTRAVESAEEEARRSWRPRLPFTAAAAVLAFVVAAFGLAFALRDGDAGDTTAARDREAGEPAGGTGDETVTEGAAPATADAEPAVLGDLGAFSDPSRLPSLVAAATTRTPSGGAEQSDLGAGFENAPCRAELAAAEPGLGAPTGFGIATYRGRPAIVVVAPGAEGRTVAVAVVVDRCEVLPAQPV